MYTLHKILVVICVYFPRVNMNYSHCTLVYVYMGMYTWVCIHGYLVTDIYVKSLQYYTCIRLCWFVYEKYSKYNVIL